MEFAFDDDLFGETDDVSANQNIVKDSQVYKPKVEPFTFFLNSSEDDMETLRMKGNYCFFIGDYANALESYCKCYSMTNSFGAKFEFFESKVRCYLKMSRRDEARRACSNLFKSATNFDQQVQALNALRDVYHATDDFVDCAIILCVLLTYFDTNVQFWYSFSTSFIRWNMTSSRSSLFGEVDNVGFCQNCLRLISAAALLRCAELLSFKNKAENSHAHLVPLESKIRQELLDLNIKEDTQKCLKLRMCQDLCKFPNDNGLSTEKTQQIACQQILDCELNFVWKRFLIKWFGFVVSDCTSCRSVLLKEL